MPSAKRIARSVRHACRYLTAPFRAEPDFVIIGAQRCGTSSLYNYLTEHPRVASALYKEVHFFDENFHRGASWYRSHFPTMLSMALRGQRIVGEATPNYLFHPLVPNRIKQTLPHLKFIVLLRNPIDRAYSHYQRLRRMGIEELSFEQAIDAEPKRLGQGCRSDYNSCSRRRFSYVSRGFYCWQLKRWFEVFPKERFLVLKSEDFFGSAGRVLDEVCEFLRLASFRPSEFKRFGGGDYAPLQGAPRARLSEIYAEPNQQLASILGRELNWG